MMQTCNILGVNIAVTSKQEMTQYLCQNIKKYSGRYICISNVHTTVMSYEDEKYRQIQNNASFALPDGKPLSIVQKKRGFEKAQRVTGPDLMGSIFEQSMNNGFRHFFIGSTKETLDTLKLKLEQRYPGLEIAGMYSPPFRRMSDLEDGELMKKVCDARADFVWIGLGAPKQEFFMADHKDKMPGLMIGVGAGFDYFAGNIKRAPKWMQKCCLEWLYRLCQEPKRLWKRYLVTNTKFLWLIITKR